jgi:CRP-like cAMP-binding protein
MILLYSDFYALTYENFQTAFRIIVNLAIPSTDKRVADRLLLELEMRGDAEGWVSLSQSDLAKLVAISLPTLQRVMRRLANSGLVTNNYGRVQVIDRDALARLCRG